MAEDTEQRFRKGHEVILSLLQKHKEHLDSLIGSDSGQQAILDHVMIHGLKTGGYTRRELQSKIPGHDSNRSKAKDRLNVSLQHFCDTCQINPPIQVYRESSDLKRRVPHFACCYARGVKSGSYVDIDELKTMLDKASRLLAEEMKQNLRSGWAEPVDKGRLSMVFDDISQGLTKTKDEQILPDPAYYIGTNADWRHIRAKQDVVRENLMAEIFGHFYKKNFCIIRTESGQGKTTLMYRFAYDHQEIFHILEMKYLDRNLLRPLELVLRQLAASTPKHVLILIDEMAALPHCNLFLKGLKTNNKIYVLTNVRQEEWRHIDMKGLEDSFEFIEPKFDRETARKIYNSLKEKGLIKSKGQDWTQVYQSSGEKLIEYVTMLTEGDHIKKLLSVQLAKMPADKSEVLRIISTADVYDMIADFSLLEKSLEMAPSIIASCLRELEGEYVKKHVIRIVRSDGVKESLPPQYHGLHRVRSQHVSEILHEHYPLAKTVRRIIDNTSVGSTTIHLSHALSSDPVVAGIIWSSLLGRINSPDDIRVFVEWFFDIPSSFVRDHVNEFQDLAYRIANVFRDSGDITDLAYCTCTCFTSQRPFYSPLTIQPFGEPWVVDFVRTIYVALDYAWLFKAIEESDRPDVVGIISFYFSRFCESKVGDFKRIVEGKCKAWLHDFPASARLIDLGLLLEGMKDLDRALAKKAVKDFEKVIVRVSNEETNYYFIENLICNVVGQIDSDVASSIAKSLNREHLESCFDRVCGYIDDESIKNIGQFDPDLEKRFLRRMKKLKGRYDKKKKTFQTEADADPTSKMPVHLPIEKAIQGISSLKSTPDIRRALEKVYSKVGNQVEVVDDLDLERIAKALDFITFPEDSEKIMYYVWKTNNNRGEKLAEKSGVSNLRLLVAKVEFDLGKKRSQS